MSHIWNIVNIMVYPLKNHTSIECHTLNLNSQVFNNTFSSSRVLCGRRTHQLALGHGSRCLMTRNSCRIFHPLKRLIGRDWCKDNLFDAYISFFPWKRIVFLFERLLLFFLLEGIEPWVRSTTFVKPMIFEI